MTDVDREYLAGLKRELRDVRDPARRDEIQAEIRRVGSGDGPSEPSQVAKAADDKPVLDEPTKTRPAKASASKPNQQ